MKLATLKLTRTKKDVLDIEHVRLDFVNNSQGGIIMSNDTHSYVFNLLELQQTIEYLKEENDKKDKEDF